MNKKIISHLLNLLPIKKNKIVFNSFSGGGYGCNPKYIAEEIIKQKIPCELVWLVSGKKVNKADFPKEIKIKKLKSWRGFYELSTANVIVSNVRLSGYFQKGFKKKKGQFYLQTWHGGFCFKKIEADLPNVSDKDIKSCVADSENIDLLLANSAWQKQMFHNAFYYNGKVSEFGIPRNDVFFSSNEKTLDKVNKYYHLENKKIALYAPTFRDDKDMSCYNIDYEKVIKKIEEKFGGEWVIISRLHPNLIRYSDIIPVSENVLNGSKYPDMQELLLAADVLITDYSSCAFDVILNKKPVFIFATDIEKFVDDRGFYFSFSETPFSFSTSNEQLLEKINDFEINEYESKISDFFLHNGGADNGFASKKSVEIINEYLNKGEFYE